MPVVYSKDYNIDHYVNDYSNILTKSEINQLDIVLKEIYDSGKGEAAILIVDTTDGEDMQGFSFRHADGELGDPELNNGLLITVALQDRSYFIQVGRGLEPYLPDILVGRIGREIIVPNFQKEDYFTGIYESTVAIRDIVVNDEVPGNLKTSTNISSNTINTIVFVFIILFIIMSIISAKTQKRYGKRHNDSDYVTAAWLIGSMLNNGKRRGGGGLGGFSGGFGGFGGGSFGGGGAGGRW